MKILAFIPSRNRACQLHALLTSLHSNAPGIFAPWVLMRADDDRYIDGYEKLMNDPVANGGPGVTHWHTETMTLREHFVQVCSKAVKNGYELIALFTDDCLYFRPTTLTAEHVHQFMSERPEVLHFSFRLGLNTLVQDYKTGRRQPPLVEKDRWVPAGGVKQEDKIISWKFRDYFVFNNYGYVFGMDGCVYRAKELLAWTKNNDFKTFRDLEGGLTLPARREAFAHTHLASPWLSNVVSIPTNSVQDDLLSPGAKHPIGTKELNDHYLLGDAIDLDAMDFSSIVGCHQEIKLHFKRAI